jgi:hypothetical protein
VTPLDHVVALGRVLDELGLPWVLGGSLASSLVGEPRSTVDIDVAVLLADEDVDGVVRAVEAEYYVSNEMVREAVSNHSSFNLLHHRTGMKVDVFPLCDDPLDQLQLGRRELIDVAPGVRVWVGSAADQILRKLHWFRLGGEVSERQWRDVLAIVRVQALRIDRNRLIADASTLGLADLLARLFAETDGT